MTGHDQDPAQRGGWPDDDPAWLADIAAEVAAYDPPDTDDAGVAYLAAAIDASLVAAEREELGAAGAGLVPVCAQSLTLKTRTLRAVAHRGAAPVGTPTTLAVPERLQRLGIAPAGYLTPRAGAGNDVGGYHIELHLTRPGPVPELRVALQGGRPAPFLGTGTTMRADLEADEPEAEVIHLRWWARRSGG